ncbi:MAG: iron-sulfur cluster assembly scaffold protein, partial [Planctomycetes bacterium]|nr:iron-sulfur cluster assembly scaffold protein [Planctomycetota bacterium]
GRASNAQCGDWVVVRLRVVEDGRVESAMFEGAGCLVSQTFASILCELAEGHSVEELLGRTDETLLDAVEFQLTPGRRACALVALGAAKLAARSPTA